MCAFVCGPPEQMRLCAWLAVDDVIARSCVSLVVTLLRWCVAWISGRAGNVLFWDADIRCITSVDWNQFILSAGEVTIV